MTFLELCQRVHHEAGLSGTGMQAVVGQSGVSARIVEWVRDSWNDVQTGQQWEFLRKRVQFTTATGQQSYTLAGIGASDARKWDMNFGRIVADGQSRPIGWIESYTAWRDRYEFSGASANLPRAVAAGNGFLAFDVEPNAAYPVTLEYWKQPQQLVANADTPTGIDASDQMAIVWLALTKYATFDNAGELLQAAGSNYQSIYNRMMRTYLPQITFSAEPMA